MLTVTKGNLFNSNCEALVNTVNIVGVMGAGIALAFKKKYPLMYAEYRNLCHKNGLDIGQIHVWKRENTPYIMNFPTKKNWQNPSEYSYIEQGLIALDVKIKELGIKSLAMPALGCSNGKLDFTKVKKMIEEFHDKHWQDMEVILYEPN